MGLDEERRQAIQVRIYLSTWRKIQQIAEEEQRDARQQAGILLERAVAHWKPAARVA